MRAVNRIAAILLALALIAAGLLVAAQVISTKVGRPWPLPTDWRSSIDATTVADQWFLTMSIVVALVGLVFIIAQVWPRRQRRLPTGGAGVWWVSRRSVERRAEVAAANSGAARVHAEAAADRRRPRWRVHLRGEAPPHRHADVERAVRNELASLGAPPDVELRLALRQPGRVG